MKISQLLRRSVNIQNPTPIHEGFSSTIRTLLFAFLLVFNSVQASPTDGEPWPPSWQVYDVAMPETEDSGTLSPTSILAMKLLPSESELVVAMRDRTVAILDVSSGKILRKSEPLSYGIEWMSVAPAKDRIIVGGGNRLVFLTLSDFKSVAEVPLKKRIFQMALSPDGERLAVAQAANEAVVVQVSDPAKKITWTLPSFGYAVSWLPDNRHCVIRCHEADIYNADSGNRVGQLTGDLVNVDRTYQLSTDGRWFLSCTDNLNIYQGDLAIWDAAEIIAHIPGDTNAVCHLSVPGTCIPALLQHIPVEKFDFASVKGFDPRKPCALPIITGEAQPDTCAVALPNGRILFAKRNGHLYCWDGTKAMPDRRWAEAVPLESTRRMQRDATSQSPTPRRSVNSGQVFRFGAAECLAFLTPPNANSEKLESVLEIVVADDPSKMVQRMVLAPCENVEIASSLDGRLIAISIGSPGQMFTAPISEIRKNPGLMRTAIKITPAVTIFDTKTNQTFTDKIWESQGANQIQFDPMGTRLLCNSRTRDGGENQLLYNIAASRVEANAPITSEQAKTLLLPDGRIVLSSYECVAVYRPVGGKWVEDVKRRDLNAANRRMVASPNGSQLLLYNPNVGGQLLSTTTLESQGWIFPTLLLSRISAYNATWSEANRIVARNGEKTEEFRIPQDVVSTIIPSLGSDPKVSQDGKWLSLRNGDKTVFVDYANGKEGVPPAGTSFERAWGETLSPKLTSGGYNHILMPDTENPGKKRIFAWLRGVEQDRWLQIPDKNLAAYALNGIWLVEVPSGKVIRHWSAPGVGSFAYNEQTGELVGNTPGAILKWKLSE